MAGTLHAALYGELTPRPDREPVTDRDAYIQFHDRSQAMGWLDTLWDMHDAGREHPLAAPGSSLVSWFQVGVGPVPSSRSLPVRPFLSCAGDVTARQGALAVAGSADSAACPKPGHLSAPRPRPDAVSAGGGVVRRRTVPDHSAPHRAAQRLHQAVGEFTHDVFRCESRIEQDPVPPPLPDGVWSGPPRYRVSFQGTLIEWSLDAIGWLGEFIADLAAREGAAVPLLLTVSHPTPDWRSTTPSGTLS